MMNTDTPTASDGSADGDRGVSPALDATLDLLANRRRRYVLYHLRREGGPASIAELAEQVAAWERDGAGRSGTAVGDDPGTRADSGSVSTERVAADLHHCQLPRLADADVITYDPASGEVALAAASAEPLAEYLDLAATEESVDLALHEETVD